MARHRFLVALGLRRSPPDDQVPISTTALLIGLCVVAVVGVVIWRLSQLVP